MIDNTIRTNRQEGIRPQYAGLKLLSILAAAVFLLIVAGTWTVDYMFTMSASLMALPLVSMLICRLWIHGLKCARAATAPMVEGESCELSITIRQPYFTNLVVHVYDALPPLLESNPEMPAVVELSGASCRFDYSITARKRGVYEIGPLKVGLHDPLGIMGGVKRFGDSTTFVVFPRPLELKSWMLVAGDGPISVTAEAAIRAVTPSGADFHGTRKYYPGDDLRRVHWKSAARARELIVMEFQDEPETGDVAIAVDTRRGSDIGSATDTTLDYAVRAAAYIAESVLVRGGRVSLLIGNTTTGSAVEASDTYGLPIILEELARAQADGDRSLADVIGSSIPTMAPGSAVALISSQVDEPLRSAARQLLAQGVNVAHVYVDPESFRQDSTSGHSDWLIHRDIPCWCVTYGESDEQ